MRVQCPQCGAGGNIPDANIPAGGRNVVCPKCQTAFLVSPKKPAASPPSGQDAAESYRQGIQLLKNKQIDAAIEQFTRVLRLEPAFQQVYRHLGLAYGQKGLWQDAVESFQKAISSKPDDVLALKNLGVAYLRLKNFEKAEESLRQAVRYAPEDHKAQAFLAKAVQQQESTKPATGDTPSSDADNTPSEKPSPSPFENAVLPPRNPIQDLLDQGVTSLDNAQYNKAIRAFQEVIRVAPKNSDGYYGLGLVYETRKDWENALKAYQKAVDVNPDDSTIQESLRFVKKQKRKAKFSLWRKKAA